MKDLSLEDLFQRVRSDADEQAFAEIFTRTEKLFFRRALQYLHSRGLAEHALQEAYLKMFRYRHSFEEGRRFLPWAFTVLDKVSYDIHHRRAGSREISIEAIQEPADPRASMLGERQLIEEALGRLPPRQRDAIRLRAEFGYSYREIGARLACTVSAVAELLYRARTRLRVELREVRR